MRHGFAEELAQIDVAAALALTKGLADRGEFDRHHGNMSHELARTQPAEAERVLNLIRPPTGNRFNQRDHYAIRVCYRMAAADLPAPQAGHVGDRHAQPSLRPRSDGSRLGENPAGRGDQLLLRQAFAILDDSAAAPDPPELVSRG